MVRKLNLHLGYYISLFAILFFGYILTYLVSPDRQLQMLIVLLISLFYVGWGILHHLINHELTAKIVVEYILIGGFGATVIFFILKGGFGL